MSGAGYPRVTHPFAARHQPGVATGRSSLDLHALGTPPAFILSQDQTLHLRSETPRARRLVECSRRSSVALEPLEFDHPSRTDRGDGRYRGPTLHRSRLIRYPDAPRNRSEGQAPRDGVLALAFRTLLSFQGTSPGCSSATHLRFPRAVTAGAAGRYHGPFKIVKDFPPARSAYSWWSTTRHVDTFTQKRRPAPPTFWASGRPPNSRRTNPLGARRPPVFRCRRRWRRPGEVLGLEELPCLQLGDGSTGFDSVSTGRPVSDVNNHNGSSGSVVPSGPS